jgi:hypothetical protein
VSHSMMDDIRIATVLAFPHGLYDNRRKSGQASKFTMERKPDHQKHQA